MVCQTASIVYGSQIRIYHTDPGIYFNPLDIPELLQSWRGPVISGIPDEHGPFVLWERTTQLTVPMPPDHLLPQTEIGWSEYEEALYRELTTRIGTALEQNSSVFEIRTRQSISFAGYLESPWLYALTTPDAMRFFAPQSRQEKVHRFTRAFASALQRVKGDLSTHYSVDISGIVGSNAGHAVTDVLASNGARPWDRLVLVDARAYLWNVVGAYRRLSGNLSIINTKADAPSLITMVGNHLAAKSLQVLLPRLRVFYVDTGSFIPSAGHLGTLGVRHGVISAYEVQPGRNPRKLNVEAGWQVVREGLDKQGPSKSISPRTRLHAAAADLGGVLFETGNTYILDEQGSLRQLVESLESARGEELGWDFVVGDDRLRAVTLPSSISIGPSLEKGKHNRKTGSLLAIESKDEVIILRERTSADSREGIVDCMVGTVALSASSAKTIVANSVWTVVYRIENDPP